MQIVVVIPADIFNMLEFTRLLHLKWHNFVKFERKMKLGI